MKYLIVIPDGAADFPLETLQNRTAFEAAKTPNLDAIASEGRQGTVATTPAGYSAGSDICCMSLLGYNPHRFHPGRAPLEAAAMGLQLREGEWIFRCNLVTVIDGLMADHSAGHITSAEGARLLGDFAEHAGRSGLANGLTFHPGISYRNLMTDASSADYAKLQTTPPHDIPGEPIRKHTPRGGEGAAKLNALIEASEAFFAEHEVNVTRREMNEAPATHIWPWGQGTRPQIESFESRFGLRGAMITAVDLLAGLAALLGWDRLEVENITGYHDTNYAGKGRVGAEALDRYDLVCVHVEAPDEASHQADAKTKVASLESIDRWVIGPLMDKLRTFDRWRVLVLPDHYTCVSTRKHDPTPVPFCMAGAAVPAVGRLPFTEQNAESIGQHIRVGHELMEYFLKSGL
ncbi:MAG: cofactor-independent phosphoglycerate mutase [Phycisphaeraceae bacterium]|nr:cofactor-independent phosphoglycerate mutase [Phycisphaeraceae bacterium]